MAGTLVGIPAVERVASPTGILPVYNGWQDRLSYLRLNRFGIAAPEGFSAGFSAPAHTLPGSLAETGRLTRFHHRFCDDGEIMPQSREMVNRELGNSWLTSRVYNKFM